MSVALALSILCVAVEDTPPPLYYVESATNITVAVDSQDGDEIAVVAFDDRLIEAPIVENSKVGFLVPSVRSRTVFDLHNRQRANAVVAQVAAYPPGQRLWGDEKIEVCSLGAPEWFVQWAAAVGIEHREFQSAEALVRSSPNVEVSRLIVLGGASGIDGPIECLEFAQRCSANVVVLDAAWYEKNKGGSVTLQIEEKTNPLGKLREWTWRDLPRFGTSWRPRLFWSNRAIVAKDDNRVLIEMFLKPDEPYFVVASLVPWREQIGRSDVADAFLAALLLESSRPAPPEPFSAGIMVYPDATEWPDENRPVLSNAINVAGARLPSTVVHVVDLRGKSEAEVSARQINELLNSIPHNTVLILGDDPILRSVRGLPERDAKPSQQNNAIWITADNLPAEPADQEALMRALTTLKIPLIPAAELIE